MQKSGLQNHFEEAARHLLLGRPADDLRFEPAEWPLFSTYLLREGLLAFFYTAIKNRDIFPEQPLFEARQNYKNALLYKDYAVCRLRDMQEQLCEKGRVVIIKGLALCEYVYREPEIRPMADVDIYLPDGTINDVREVLIDNGFERVESYPYLLRTRELVIDLHEDLWGVRRIAERSSLIPQIEYRFIPSRMLPGYFIPVPLLLAVHAAYHCLKHGFSKKIWLLDQIKLINSGTFDIAALRSIDNTVVQVALTYLHGQGLISDAVPQTRTMSPLRRKFLSKALEHHGREGVGEILMALCTSTWSRTAVYFFATFFPKKQVLQEMYGKHPYLFLLLRRLYTMARYGFGILLWKK